MGMSRRQFVASATSSASRSVSRRQGLLGFRISRRARHCRAARAGTRPPLRAAGESTAPPRSRARSFTHPIFAPPTYPAGLRRRRTPCSFARRMRPTSSPVLIFRGCTARSNRRAWSPLPTSPRRHSRARVLRGRSVLSGRKNAAVSGPAAGDAVFQQFDAFDQARLALRAPGCARYGKETGPVADCALRIASFRACCRSDRAGAGCLSPLRDGWVTPRSSATSTSRSGRRPTRRPRTRSVFLRRRHPSRAFRRQSGLVCSRSHVRDAIRRPDVSRAKAGIADTTSPGEKLRSWSARSRRSRLRNCSPILLGEARAEFKPAGSTPISPIWAAALAAAITR